MAKYYKVLHIPTAKLVTWFTVNPGKDKTYKSFSNVNARLLGYSNYYEFSTNIFLTCSDTGLRFNANRIDFIEITEEETKTLNSRFWFRLNG